MLEESDEMRKKYFTMTGHDWACAENYHVSVDTSLLPPEETAEVLIELFKRKQMAG